jgi:hypothetical protein
MTRESDREEALIGGVIPAGKPPEKAPGIDEMIEGYHQPADPDELPDPIRGRKHWTGDVEERRANHSNSEAKSGR